MEIITIDCDKLEKDVKRCSLFFDTISDILEIEVIEMDTFTDAENFMIVKGKPKQPVHLIYHQRDGQRHELRTISLDYETFVSIFGSS
jgi:hypothetical protein